MPAMPLGYFHDVAREGNCPKAEDSDGVARWALGMLRAKSPEEAGTSEYSLRLYEAICKDVSLVSLITRMLKEVCACPQYKPAVHMLLSAMATELENETALGKLLDANAYVEYVMANGRTALHSCADLRIVKLLLAAGAKLNRLDHVNVSPLCVACLYNKIAKSRMLLEWRADVNGASPFTWSSTPLMIACSRGHHDLASLLIKAGADWRRELSGHKEGTPGTALEFAMQRKGHDGPLAQPEPDSSAEPEPKAETECNPGRDSTYPTLTPTSTYPHR